MVKTCSGFVIHRDMNYETPAALAAVVETLTDTLLVFWESASAAKRHRFLASLTYAGCFEGRAEQIFNSMMLIDGAEVETDEVADESTAAVLTPDQQIEDLIHTYFAEPEENYALSRLRSFIRSRISASALADASLDALIQAYFDKNPAAAKYLV